MDSLDVVVCLSYSVCLRQPEQLDAAMLIFVGWCANRGTQLDPVLFKATDTSRTQRNVYFAWESARVISEVRRQ